MNNLRMKWEIEREFLRVGDEVINFYGIPGVPLAAKNRYLLFKAEAICEPLTAVTPDLKVAREKKGSNRERAMWTSEESDVCLFLS